MKISKYKLTYRISSFSSSPLMGEVRWGWRKKYDHPPLTPPIQGGEKSRRRLNLLLKQCIHEGIGIKFLYIICCFTQPNKFYGNVYFVAHAQHNATLCRTVQLCQEYACDVYRLFKHLCLGDRILSSCGVEHHQHFMGGARNSFGNDPFDFAEFIHEIFVGMKATRSVHNYYMDTPCNGGFYGIIGNRCRVRTGLMLYDLRTDALTPYIQLLHGCRPEGIAGCHQDLFAVFNKNVCKFCYGCGFANSIHPDHHDNRRGIGGIMNTGLPGP